MNLVIDFKNKEAAKKSFSSIGIAIKWNSAEKAWQTEATAEEVKAAAAKRYADLPASWAKEIEQYLPVAATVTATSKSVTYELYNQNGMYFG